MTINAYIEGELVTVNVTFVDEAGDAADPTTVTVSYQYTRETAITYLVYGTDAEVQKTATGAYHVHLDTSGKGAKMCSYRFVGTGAIQSASQGQFYVIPADPVDEAPA